MIDGIADLLEKFVENIKKLPRFLFKVSKLALVIIILILIIFFTVSGVFSKQVGGTCIEAYDFGAKNNRILAKPEYNSDYIVDNKYKYDEIVQKIRHTDLGLKLNGDPIIIRISGSWLPWLGNYTSNIKSGDERKIVNNSVLENKGLPDKRFYCALEKYKITDSNKKFSSRNEENEFYYIRNYYKGIEHYKNSTNEDKTINMNDKTVTVKGGESLIYGVDELPERQKECWLTRGAGLYLASYGFKGRTQPTAYHHLLASTMICTRQNWFNGGVNSKSDVITKYKVPANEVKTSDSNFWKSKSCKDANNTSCSCDENSKKDANSGMCSYYDDKKNLIYCDCNQYEEKKYTLNDFISNYFDIRYHLGSDVNVSDTNGDILQISDTQVTYNIELHEDLLYKNNVENVGYIIASSIEKFANACYKIRKDVDGNKVRDYSSYFLFGPKQLYKNVSSGLQNVEYDYGEQIKMFIADKYYKDNDGFYDIEIVSGIELDDAGSFVKKLQEIEFFLLGTPKKGQDDDRADGIVAIIFNNILTSKLIIIARILMVFMVVIYGFKMIFGLIGGGDQYKTIIGMIIKITILTVLLSNNAFQIFTTVVINFFINGTIGIIDLVSGIFSNSFISSNNVIAMTGGLQHANEIASLSRNFAIVDEILAFFRNHTFITKVISFSYNLDQLFGVGIIISVAVFATLIFYVFKLIQSIIPFIMVLLQLALVLPLAPICLALSLIEQMKFIFEGWVKFVLGKCLELVVFFTTFYFFTSIIDNFIKSLISFRVCFIKLGDHLMPNTSNWLGDFVKSVLNLFIAVRHDGLPDRWFIYYCINIIIIILCIKFFDTILNSVMKVIGGMLTIDGASGSGGSMQSDKKNGLQAQLGNFVKSSGLAEAQKSGLLEWTRNTIDLSNDKILTGNLSSIGKKVFDNGRQIWNIKDGDIKNDKDFFNIFNKVATDFIGKPKSDGIMSGTIFDRNTWGDGKTFNDLKTRAKNARGKNDKNYEDEYKNDNNLLRIDEYKEELELAGELKDKMINSIGEEDIYSEDEYEERSGSIIKDEEKLEALNKELDELRKTLGDNKSVDMLRMAIELNKNKKQVTDAEMNKILIAIASAKKGRMEISDLNDKLMSIIGPDRILKALGNIVKEKDLLKDENGDMTGSAGWLSKLDGSSTEKDYDKAYDTVRRLLYMSKNPNGGNDDIAVQAFINGLQPGSKNLLSEKNDILLSGDSRNLIKEKSGNILSGDTTELINSAIMMKREAERKKKLEDKKKKNNH